RDALCGRGVSGAGVAFGVCLELPCAPGCAEVVRLAVVLFGRRRSVGVDFHSADDVLDFFCHRGTSMGQWFDCRTTGATLVRELALDSRLEQDAVVDQETTDRIAPFRPGEARAFDAVLEVLDVGGVAVAALDS